MKVKKKSRSHKYDINRPTSGHGLTYTNKHKKVPQYDDAYMY